MGISSTAGFRSSRPEVFFKIGVLKLFCKIHRKPLMAKSLFDKVEGLRPATFKNRHHYRCFPVNFVTFLITPNFYNIYERLLLRYQEHTFTMVKIMKQRLLICYFEKPFSRVHLKRLDGQF